MNNKFILLITPLLFSSCNNGSLFVPSKVFDNDNYERIGVARTLNSNATISNESKNDLIDLKTNYQLLIVNCQLSTVNCHLSTVNCQL